MKNSSDAKTPRVSVVFAVEDPKHTLQNRDGYRLIMRCSQKKTETGSKAQTVPNRV